MLSKIISDVDAFVWGPVMLVLLVGTGVLLTVRCNLLTWRNHTWTMKKTLSNNVIHSIQQADSSCLWITTHLGVNRFSQDSRQVVGYYDFTGDYYLHSNPKGDTWVVSDEGIFYYNTYHKKFVHL